MREKRRAHYKQNKMEEHAWWKSNKHTINDENKRKTHMEKQRNRIQNPNIRTKHNKLNKSLMEK